MILDSSALLAILLAETGSERLIRAVADAPLVAIGAPTLVETAIVLTSRLARDARPLLNDFLREAAIEIIPFTPDHYDIAVDTFQRYGKGRHPAALNFGDCLTYAIARVSGFPLLFTSEDFSRTDLLG